jgi:hypothetical protein
MNAKILLTILFLCTTFSNVGADELNPIAIPLPYDVSKSLSYDVPDYDPDEPAVITILMVYTQAAGLWAANTNYNDINTIVTMGMDYANLTADNSQTNVEFEVIDIIKTDYVESGSASDDLRRLTNLSDGYMDDVHEVRDATGADLVMLIADLDDAGGVSWLMTDPNGYSNYGFSVVRVKQAMHSTMVHEIGHNIGLHHSKLQNTQPGPGVFSYSAGSRWVGSDGIPYCSVMTYTGGSYYPDGISHNRVPIFSNPRVLYMDEPTGDVVDADNSRTVMEMKHVIAAYRYESGSLQVDIDPDEAKWRVVGSSTWNDSWKEIRLPIGPTEIEFSEIPGWVTPQPMTILIEENEFKELQIFYEIERCIILIAPTAGGELIPSQQEVDYGTIATFQVQPHEGYSIGNVHGCGGSLSGSTYTTEPIHNDCTITARFDLVKKPEVVTSNDSGGGGGGCFISTMFSTGG